MRLQRFIVANNFGFLKGLKYLLQTNSSLDLSEYSVEGFFLNSAFVPLLNHFQCLILFNIFRHVLNHILHNFWIVKVTISPRMLMPILTRSQTISLILHPDEMQMGQAPAALCIKVVFINAELYAIVQFDIWIWELFLIKF